MRPPSSDPMAEALLVGTLLDGATWTPERQRSVEALADDDVTGALAPVWRVIRHIALDGRQPDPASVASIAGEPWTVTRLMGIVPPETEDASLDAAVDHLLDMSRRRRLFDGIARVSQAETTDDAVSALEALLADMERVADRSLPPSIGDLAQRAYDDAMEAVKRRVSGEHDVSLGVPTGIPRLDYMTGGLEPGQLAILAARTSVGKTSIMLQVARHAQYRGPVLVVSREVRAPSLGRKVLASTASAAPEAERITSPMLRSGRLGRDHIGAMEASLRVIQAERLWVDDRSRNVEAIAMQARRVQSAHGRLALLAVDYVQLLAPTVAKDATREQAVASISRGLKDLAVSLDIPVLALAQLNRVAANITPELHHLRDSGAIEQDADLVLFLHVPEGASADERRDLIVAKQRDGQVGTIPCAWLAHRQEIRELDVRRPVAS